MYRKDTIRDLEQLTCSTPFFTWNQESAQLRYKEIRELQFCDVTDADIHFLFHHQLYTEALLQECFHRLYENPVRGIDFNGQMLEVIANQVSAEFWKKHDHARNSLHEFLAMVNTFNVADLFNWSNNKNKWNYIIHLKELQDCC